MNLITKQLDIVDIKQLDETEGTIRAVISSGLPDRQGDMIDQSSWNLDEYKKNPVVLWSHDHTQPAIGQALEIGLNKDGMLEALIKFAIEEYDFAKTIFKLYAGRFMRAFSVGFVSNKIEEINDIRILRDNVLYEFSAVNVGADALALAKQKGIDISCFEKTKKSPACRMEGETIEECVSRKIPEIMHENPEMKRDQAVAIAYSICKKKCGEKCFEKEGRVLSAKNRSIIERARLALDEVLEADSNSRSDKPTKIINYKKILNKAIRELLEAKKQ